MLTDFPKFPVYDNMHWSTYNIPYILAWLLSWNCLTLKAKALRSLEISGNAPQHGFTIQKT
jgi:hypothetical protein